MPGEKTPGPSVKDKKLYEKLRDEGNSKEKSARIANAANNSSREKVSKKGGNAGSYERTSKQDLLKKAKNVGIKGRSKMTKKELIKALRNH
jgi:hypothetical protein